jgi:hypothetical protein
MTTLTAIQLCIAQGSVRLPVPKPRGQYHQPKVPRVRQLVPPSRTKEASAAYHRRRYSDPAKRARMRETNRIWYAAHCEDKKQKARARWAALLPARKAQIAVKKHSQYLARKLKGNP